jgi:hypothetical protein
MKFSIKFLAVIVLFTNFAYAEWIPYANNTDRAMILYYQNLSLSKKNEYTRVLIRKNFKTAKEVILEDKKIIYKSVINTQLIDCDKNRYATTEVVMYEKWDAAGEKLYTTLMNNLSWNNVRKNSVQEGLMQKVCFRV